MIYKYTIFFAMFLQTYSVVSQATHWVSNRNDGVIVDFTTLQDAYDAASPGDTLILYPSPTNYGTLSISKCIHIKGIGYKIDNTAQPSLEIKTFAHAASLSSIGINTGANKSSFESLSIGSLNTLDADSITIKRCEFSSLNLTNSSYNEIRQCNINLTSTGIALHLNNSSNNFIENTFIYSNGHSLLSTTSSTNNIIQQCVINVITLYNSLAVNNIFFQQSIGGTLNETMNNVFMSGSPGVDSFNNIYGATNVFVGWPTQGTYSFDSRWQLTPTSPAAGAGLNGEDCGIFGGPNPYKLSGIYNRPLIYELTVPPYVPNGSDLNITVKVRAEN